MPLWCKMLLLKLFVKSFQRKTILKVDISKSLIWKPDEMAAAMFSLAKNEWFLESGQFSLRDLKMHLWLTDHPNHYTKRSSLQPQLVFIIYLTTIAWEASSLQNHWIAFDPLPPGPPPGQNFQVGTKKLSGPIFCFKG